MSETHPSFAIAEKEPGQGAESVVWQPDGGTVLDDAGWQVLAGPGTWSRSAGAVRLTTAGANADWHSLALPAAVRVALHAGDELAIEATVGGVAIAAGISFGPDKDFLVPLAADSWARRLSLELHRESDGWTFRVDGRLATSWSDRAVTTKELLTGVPRLAALGPKEVTFTDVAVRRFPSRCRISVIINCYRFVQRLRIALSAWCRQVAPVGSFEVIVVNPASPDGTAEHLAAVAATFPDVRIRELFVDGPPHKPLLINQAVQASSGDWVWLTDADCLFPTNAVQLVLDQLDHGPEAEGRLLYGSRQHLRRADTDALLAMALDGVEDFAALADRADERAPQQYPWGYTQIVPRRVLLDVPYREDMQHFAHSDGIFIDGCRRWGIEPLLVEGLNCLHMSHPFAWYGTKAYC
jgi:hypothetical protein